MHNDLSAYNFTDIKGNAQGLAVKLACVIFEMNCYSKGILLIFLLDNAIGSTLLDTKWHAWKTSHGVVYRDWMEESLKRRVWEDNYNAIAEHNRGNYTYKLGLNRFADLVSKVGTDLVSKLGNYIQPDISEQKRV